MNNLLNWKDNNSRDIRRWLCHSCTGNNRGSRGMKRWTTTVKKKISNLKHRAIGHINIIYICIVDSGVSTILYFWAHIRWTCHRDGDCRIYYTILNKLLHNSYISNGKSNPHVVYLHELFRCPVHVMKRPSSEEWHIAIGPWFIIYACCVVNLVSLGIYCHALIGYQLVQLRGCLRSFYMHKCASRPLTH